MKKLRKISLIICGFLLVLTGLFFVGCDKTDLTKVRLSASEQYVTMNVGDERTISFNLENYSSSMTGKLEFDILSTTNANSISFTPSDARNGRTTLDIVAKEGGTTMLKAFSPEGQPDCWVTVNIKVLRGPDQISENGQKLFVTETSALENLETYFTLEQKNKDEEINQRELSFYFYGTLTDGVNAKPITPNDVKTVDDEGTSTFEKKFNKISLYQEKYLIFETDDGLFTLRENGSDERFNKPYDFISVQESQGDLVIPENALVVKKGDEFAFLAVSDYNEDAYKQQTFVVLADIGKPSLSYGYPNKGEYTTNSSIPFVEGGEIILVPNRSDDVTEYGRVILKLNEYDQIVGRELKIKPETENENVASIIPLENEGLPGYYEIKSRITVTSVTRDTTINMRIYYDGFENVNNPSVNMVVPITVNAKFQPDSVTTSLNELIFYNKYYLNYGWRDIYVSRAPIYSDFDYLLLSYNPTQVTIRYNGQFEEVESSDSQRVLKIYDLSMPLSVRGASSNNVVNDGKINLKLYYSDIANETENPYVETDINYKIAQGAGRPQFYTDYSNFQNEDVYLNINGGIQSFVGLYANAEYQSLNFAFTPANDDEIDVVSLSYDTPTRDGSGNYALNLKVLPHQIGRGTYTIQLDNGYSQTLTFNVIETITDISILNVSTSTRVEIEKMDDFVADEALENRVGSEDKIYNRVFIQNGNAEFGQVARLRLIANGNPNSTALGQYSFSEEGDEDLGDFFNIYTSGITQGFLDFEIDTVNNGCGFLTIKVTGAITVNFRMEQQVFLYKIAVVSYSLIPRLSVYKLRDGEANYGDANVPASSVRVYSGALNDSARTANFKLSSPSGYIFYQYVEEEDGYTFEERLSAFDEAYVYWTLNNKEFNIFIGNKQYDYMVGDRTYEIKSALEGDIIATFNPATMTFVADIKAEFQELRLFANVRQRNRTFSYTITVRTSKYISVNEISIIPSVDEEGIILSDLDAVKTKTYRVSFAPIDATNASLDFEYIPGNASGQKVYLFGEDNSGITFESKQGYYTLSLDWSWFAGTDLASSTEALTGTIRIYANDWKDSSGNFMQSYNDQIRVLNVKFANGTWNNPFYLETPEQVLGIKESSHYKLSTSIDMSDYSDRLPLDINFAGTIVGVNNYAKITGIHITNQKDKSYGLFKSIASSGRIENISFEGTINISSAEDDANIGIVAGKNFGTLRNVGVVVTSNSALTLLGRANVGLLVGQNEGKIIQDFSVLNTQVEESEGERVDSFYGLNPKNVVYMNKFVLTVRLTQVLQVNVGGVVGLNKGQIIKVEDLSLNLYGYGQYFSFANIELTTNLGIENVKNNYLGGVAGLSTAGSSIFGALNAENGDTAWGFKAGRGLVAGGRVKGLHYVGGVVGKFEGKMLNGITSRTYVSGFKTDSNLTIATIAGGVTEANNTNPYFAIEAVDDNSYGIDVSMVVVRSLENTEDGNPREIVLDETNNMLAFALPQDKGYNKDADGKNVISVKTYVTRTQLKIEDSPLEVDPYNFTAYYGDFVVVKVATNKTFVYQQKFFDMSADNFGIRANEDGGFEKLNKSDVEDEDLVFYAFYFKSSGYVGGGLDDKEANVADAQNILDKKFNTLSSSSRLYPIKTESDSLLFKSRDTQILDFGTTGILSIYGTGLARIDVTSILNLRETKVIYIYVTNYFNNDATANVIYTTTMEQDAIIDGTYFELKGNNQVTLRVKPDYTFESGEDKITSTGTVRVESVSINLVDNTELYPFATTNKTTLDGKQRLRISTSGQMLTISRNSDTDDTIEYDIILGARLGVKIGAVNYFVPINRQFKDETWTDEVNDPDKDNGVTLKYSKGAESIKIKDTETIPVTTVRGQDVMVEIVSQSRENSPYYTIFNQENDIVQSTRVAGSYDRLFTIQFNPDSSTQTGIQLFKMTVLVNKDSNLYKNRHERNIYGKYTLTLYAESDTTKSVSIPILLDNMNVSQIGISNYPRYERLNLDDASVTTSDRAYPGTKGMLMLSIKPEDAEFDYIEITNDESVYTAGNGWATFSLLAKLASPSGDGVLFKEEFISGSALNNGLRLYQKDIMSLYNDKKDDEEHDLYEDYNGIIYLNYVVGASGVVENSITQFKVMAYKDGKPVDGLNPPPIRLYNSLTFHANVSIEGKQPIGSLNHPDGGRIIYADYNLARGLRYRLNLDYYGFLPNNISLELLYYNSLSQVPTLVEGGQAEITRDSSGNYYIEVTTDFISYNSSPQGYPLLIRTTARYEDADLEPFVSYTKINILDYVLNYPYGEENLDIVDEMVNGVISVEIGNKQNLSINMFDFVEFDENNDDVLAKIRSFMNDLTEKGAWTVYTNLNTSGFANGESVDEKNYVSRYELKNATLDNIYFRSSGLSITPLSIHDYRNSYYVFTYQGGFKIGNGAYQWSDDADAETLKTTFVFDVFPTSSLEHPQPIRTYEQLLEMNAGAHYILLDDITLENSNSSNSFTPISTQIASFDGNGHTISFNGIYNFSATNVGLFETIASGTIIKNLNISLSGDTRVSVAQTSFRFGLLAGQNYGIVTNCNVYGQTLGNSNYSLSVNSTQGNASCYVAGLVGQNAGGTITNSRSSVSITTQYNVAGLVGTNTGKIASSYYMGGKLRSQASEPDNFTGGLVVENEEDGQIITSYVSGNRGYYPYSTDSVNIIDSSTISAGFAYLNNGVISDCYSNIIIQGTAGRAGFVYTNGGTIKNCFSLSKVKNDKTTSYGFSAEVTNEDATGRGTFSDCYFLVHNADDEHGKINTEINDDYNYEGIEQIDVGDFGYQFSTGDTADAVKNFESKFATYAYSRNITNHAVWFYSDGSTDTLFNDVLLSSGRLELVAPNIIAVGERQIEDVTTDSVTGDVVYSYSYTDNSEKLGSIKNPRLIQDAETFEQTLLSPASVTNCNFDNYRLIADINYSNYQDFTLSSLYKITLAGSLEGNGMELSGVRLASQKAMVNAGLFAGLGRNRNDEGSIMNLTYRPLQVNFTNTNSVGGLVGVLSYGYIYNVDILNSDTTEEAERVVVTAKNFAGGLVGRAINNYKIKNVTTSISAVASFRPDYSNKDVTHDYYSQYGDYSNYSYAGSLIGFAGGQGVISDIRSTEVGHINADRAGVVFGGVDNSVSVDHLVVEMNDNLEIMAYKYGGFVAGENRGQLRNVEVQGVQQNKFYRVTTPDAIGGIAGLMSNGIIENASVDQAINIDYTLTGSAVSNVKYIGGIAGLVRGDSTISHVTVSQDITVCCNYLGGAVGYVDGANLKLDNITLSMANLLISGQVSDATIGGVIGKITGTVAITNTKVSPTITLDMKFYSENAYSHYGHFVGEGEPYLMNKCTAIGNIKVYMRDYSINSGDTLISRLIKKEPTDSSEEPPQYIPDGYDNVFYTQNVKKFDNVTYYGTGLTPSEDGQINFAGDSTTIVIRPKDKRNIRIAQNLIGSPSRELPTL